MGLMASSPAPEINHLRNQKGCGTLWAKAMLPSAEPLSRLATTEGHGQGNCVSYTHRNRYSTVASATKRLDA